MAGLIGFVIVEMGVFMTGSGLILAILTTQQSASAQQNESALAYVFIGAASGLVLGVIFAALLKRTLLSFTRYPALPLWLGAGVGGWFLSGFMLAIRSGQPSDWRIVATVGALGTIFGAAAGGFFSTRLSQVVIPAPIPRPPYLGMTGYPMYPNQVEEEKPYLVPQNMPDWINDLFVNNEVAAAACRELYKQIMKLNQAKDGLPIDEPIKRITDDFKTYIGTFKMKSSRNQSFLTFYFQCDIDFPQQPPQLFIEKAATAYQDGEEITYSGKIFQQWQTKILTLSNVVDDVLEELKL